MGVACVRWGGLPSYDTCLSFAFGQALDLFGCATTCQWRCGHSVLRWVGGHRQELARSETEDGHSVTLCGAWGVPDREARVAAGIKPRTPLADYGLHSCLVRRVGEACASGTTRATMCINSRPCLTSLGRIMLVVDRMRLECKKCGLPWPPPHETTGLRLCRHSGLP